MSLLPKFPHVSMDQRTGRDPSNKRQQVLNKKELTEGMQRVALILQRLGELQNNQEHSKDTLNETVTIFFSFLSLFFSLSLYIYIYIYIYMYIFNFE